MKSFLILYLDLWFVGRIGLFNRLLTVYVCLPCLFSLCQTLRPFIYTKLNSRPDYFTTPKPTSPSTPVPSTPTTCPSSVPVWVLAVFGVTGLLIGWGVTWLFMRRWIKKQKSKDKVKEKEMKGTSF